MAKKFKAFEERPKPRERPRRHKKNLNKQEKRMQKKYNDDGSRIPDAERKNYENIIVIKDGAIKPSEEEINAKIQELKDADTAKANARTSGKAKLKAGEALTDAEIEALFGK